MEAQETHMKILDFFKLTQNIILFQAKVAATLVKNSQQIEKNSKNRTTVKVCSVFWGLPKSFPRYFYSILLALKKCS